jgi:hypothetical protein
VLVSAAHQLMCPSPMLHWFTKRSVNASVTVTRLVRVSGGNFLSPRQMKQVLCPIRCFVSLSLLRCTERTRCVMLFRLYACARPCQSLHCRFTFLQNVMSTVRMLSAWTLVHTFYLVPSPVSVFIDPSRKLSTTGRTQYLAGLLITYHDAKF